MSRFGFHDSTRPVRSTPSFERTDRSTVPEPNSTYPSRPVRPSETDPGCERTSPLETLGHPEVPEQGCLCVPFDLWSDLERTENLSSSWLFGPKVTVRRDGSRPLTSDKNSPDR